MSSGLRNYIPLVLLFWASVGPRLVGAADLVVDDTTFVLEGVHHYGRIEVGHRGRLLLRTLGLGERDSTGQPVWTATVFAESVHVDSSGWIGPDSRGGTGRAGLFSVYRRVRGTLDTSVNVLYDLVPTVTRVLAPEASGLFPDGLVRFEFVVQDSSAHWDHRADQLLTKIEVSQDGFESVWRCYDQAAAAEGWSDSVALPGVVVAFVPTEPLPPGAYAWRACAHDGYAWGPPSQVQTFFVDGSPPVGVPDPPRDTGVWSTSSEIRFEWSADLVYDAETGIGGYRLAVGTTLDTANLFAGDVGDSLSCVFRSGREGVTYFARVCAVNQAGMAGVYSAPSDGITVDEIAAPPQVTSPEHGDAGPWCAEAAPTLSLSAPPDLSGIAGYYWLVDQEAATVPSAGDQWLPCTGADQELALPTLPDGIWFLHVVSKDQAGNEGRTAVHYCFVVDGAPPTLRHMPLDRIALGQAAVVEAQASDAGGEVSCRLHYRGVGDSSFASVDMNPDSAGFFAARLPMTGDPGEEMEYYVEATDQAGHTATMPPRSPRLCPLRVVAVSTIETEVISWERAEIPLPGGGCVIVPPNALKHSASVRAWQAEEPGVFPPELRPARPVTEVCVHPPTALDRPVTLVLALPDTVSMHEDRLAAFMRSEQGWVFVQGRVDTASHSIAVDTECFHESEAPVGWVVAADLRPPVIELVAPTDSAYVPGSFAAVVSVRDSGSGLDRSSVQMLLDGVVVGSPQYDASLGQWRAGFVGEDGLHTVTVRARDRVGYLAEAAYGFRVVRPRAVEVRAVPDTVHWGDSVVLSARIWTPISTVIAAEWEADPGPSEGPMPLPATDGAFDSAEEAVEITVVMPQAGMDSVLELHVRGQDAFGHWGPPGRVRVVVVARADTLAPQLPGELAAAYSGLVEPATASAGAAQRPATSPAPESEPDSVAGVSEGLVEAAALSPDSLAKAACRLETQADTAQLGEETITDVLAASADSAAEAGPAPESQPDSAVVQGGAPPSEPEAAAEDTLLQQPASSESAADSVAGVPDDRVGAAALSPDSLAKAAWSLETQADSAQLGEEAVADVLTAAADSIAEAGPASESQPDSTAAEADSWSEPVDAHVETALGDSTASGLEHDSPVGEAARDSATAQVAAAAPADSRRISRMAAAEDHEGPVVTALAVFPDTVVVGGSFTLAAAFSDASAGGTGVHAGQYIIYVDGREELRGFLLASDGSFDQPTESAEIVARLEADCWAGRPAAQAAACLVSVRAEDDLGNWGAFRSDSLWVFVQMDTTPPPRVEALEWADVVHDESGRISLTWAACAAQDLAHYLVYRAATPVGDPAEFERLAAVSGTVFLDSAGVETPWFYAVAAVDSSGNRGVPGAWAGPAVAMDDVPPAVVVGTLSPAPGDEGVLPAGALHLDLVDRGEGPDPATIRVAVNGKTYGLGSSELSITSDHPTLCHVTLTPQEGFPEADTILVSITASDRALPPNQMAPLVHMFLTGDRLTVESGPGDAAADTSVVCSADSMAFLVVPRALADAAGLAVVPAELPAPPREGMQLVGGAYRIVAAAQPSGPLCLRLRIRLFDGSLGGLRLLRFDDFASTWEEVPAQASVSDRMLTARVATPGLFQMVGLAEVDPPYVSELSPAHGATRQPPDTPIGFRVLDDEAGVDSASVALTVDGSVFGPNDLVMSGTESGYWVRWECPEGCFEYGDTVRVSVRAQDRALRPNLLETQFYFCVAPDTTAPSVELIAPQADSGRVAQGSLVEWRIADAETGVDLSALVLVANGDSVATDGIAVQGESTECTLRYGGLAAVTPGDSLMLVLRASDRARVPNTFVGEYLFTIPPDTAAPVLAGLSASGSVDVLDSLSFHLLDDESGTDPVSVELFFNGIPVPGSELLVEGTPWDCCVVYLGTLDPGLRADTVHVRVHAQDLARRPNKMVWEGTFEPSVGRLLAQLRLVSITEPLIAGVSSDAAVLAVVEGADPGQPWDVWLHCRRGGVRQYVASKMIHTDQGYGGIIPPDLITSCGLEFYLEARCEEDSLIYPPAGPSWAPVCPEVRIPEGETMGYLTAGDGTDRMAYRMASVPLILDDPSPISVLADELGEYDADAWQVLRYASEGYEEYPYTDDIIPGRAFWIAHRGSDLIDVGPARSTLNGGRFQVALEPGWNQVGVPFDFSVSWADVIQANPGLAVESPWAYVGWYEHDVPLLHPWEGYWIRSLAGEPVVLSFPATAAAFEGTRSPSTPPRSPGEWAIRVVAASDNVRDADNFVGCLRDASETWDEHDFGEPPPVGRFISLSFPHEDWPFAPERYAGDFRPTGLETSVWLMEVEASHRVAVELSFEALTPIPEDTRLLLADSLGAPLRDLTAGAAYSVAVGSQRVLHLQIVAEARPAPDGSAETQQAETPQLDNYPNPFNVSTTIVFYVPPPAGGEAPLHCRLAVYNMLGQEVRRLVDEEHPSGWRSVLWDGRDFRGRSVGNGTYFCKLITDDFSLMKRMIFLK